VARQLGFSAVLGPRTVAVTPVVVGAVKPQGLVNMVAVTDESAGIVLSLIFNTKPTIVTSTGSVIVLVTNKGPDDEVPNPTQPPSPTD
jgi:hypothetical protein